MEGKMEGRDSISLMPPFLEREEGLSPRGYRTASERPRSPKSVPPVLPCSREALRKGRWRAKGGRVRSVLPARRCWRPGRGEADFTSALARRRRRHRASRL